MNPESNVALVTQGDTLRDEQTITHVWRRITAAIGRIGLDPADTVDDRLQKTLLSSGCLAVILAASIWGAAYILLGEPLAGAISLSYSTLGALSILFFYRSRNYAFFRSSQLLLGLLLPFLHTLALGGLLNSSGVILWSLIIPLGALLLSEPRHALNWWFAYLVLIVVSSILQPFLRPVNNLPPGFIIGFFVLNISAVSSIFIFTLYYFINQKNLAYKMLRIEEEKSQDLLLNILPSEIATILKNDTRIIAEQFEEASILFADLVGFTAMTEELSPVDIVNLLNDIFSHFDSLVEKYRLEKIRTIGDNYMVAAGVPSRRPDHAIVIANLALEMNEYIRNYPAGEKNKIEFRIGINSGPVVGGVIGRKKFVYDVWGDAVNIASRMESHGLPGKIHITRATYELIRDHFSCTPRGSISIKGKGVMDTFFLLGVKT